LIAPLCVAGSAISLSAEPAAMSPDDRTALRERFKSGVFRWGGDAEGGAPYQLRDPHHPDRVIGFEVELVDAIVERLSADLQIPLRAEFMQYEWGSLPLGLERNDFDVISAGFEITPERQEKLRFSRPYYVYAQQLVTRRDDNRIQSLADCRDKAVATLSTSAAERVLTEAGVLNIVGFDGQVEPYLDLQLGRVDCVLLDAPIATFLASTNPKLKLVGDRFAQGEYGIGLRLEDRPLADAIDRALGELIASGRLKQIYRKWHIWNDDQAQLAQAPRKAEELQALGFDASGKPLVANEPPSSDGVNIRITDESAKLWTFDQYAPLLLRAAGTTVYLTFASMALAMVVGLAICLCRLYGSPPLRAMALVYVEFFRGVPLLLLLFLLYFGIGGILESRCGITISAELTAILGFGLNYAAYESEIYRSAILAVPSRQWEAAWALGMSKGLAFRRIIFPQAIRTALGPMTNDFVALFKDTSLVSVIAVRELTKEYRVLSNSSQKFLELGILTAVLYLAMSIPLGYLSRYLEKRWGANR
jgi:polar amino acid transport system substrate-binding protein